jgi:sugar phosphate isomerase/epimerase
MRLSISNIAWENSEDEDVAQLLRHHGIDAIDIAPARYFSEPTKATGDEITQVRKWWADRGIEIIAMQALLSGTTGLNVFGPGEVQDAMLRHLDAVCRIGAGLGATRLVFGSPKNRDRSGLTDERAMQVATAFFRRLGDVAQANGVTICLEPNPARYGANFMTSSAETAAVVMQVAHASIRMQLDTGSLAINGEDPAIVVEACASLIRHIHASEPDLVPLGDGKADHGRVAKVLARALPQHPVSIEMLATQNEPHLVAIDRALGVAIRAYRDTDDRCRQSP